MESLPEISTQPTSLTAARRSSPRPAQSIVRKSVEVVRVARSEWTSREQLVNNLRSENLALAARLRGVEEAGRGHTQLLEACAGLAQDLGCSVEGVACDSVGSILRTRVSVLTQENVRAREALGGVKGELEKVRGELAASSVRCSSLNEQLDQAQTQLQSKDLELNQLKSEGEEMRQSCARLGATVASLRGQLTESQSTSSPSLSDQLTQSHTQLGRARKDLADKSSQLQQLQAQFSLLETDVSAARERASSAENMYSELWAGLVAALEMDDSVDPDSLTGQVATLLEENRELALRMDTVNKSIKSVELESRANRETIMRLVSEAKQHEHQAKIISGLEKDKAELCEQLQTSSREKNGLEERLGAAKETLLAQERELEGKDGRIESMSQKMLALQSSSETTRSLVTEAEEKLMKFCESLRAVLSAESAESSSLLSSVQQLVKDASVHAGKSSQHSARVAELESQEEGLREELASCRAELRRQALTIQQLEGDKTTDTLATQSLTKHLDKYKAFTRSLLNALTINTATAEILSGDLALDAILTRAQQLAKQETESLAEKQTAVYSLQRKLKTCRQSLDNKEVHLGLVQKKLSLLEERMVDYSSREQDWSASADKLRKLEKALERLQNRTAQQKEAILLLKQENSQVQQLKSENSLLEERVGQLTSSLEEVSQARVQQAQLLAEARAKQSKPAWEPATSRERAETEQLQGELETARQQLTDSQTRQAELEELRKAVIALLTLSDGEAPDNYSLIASLEKLVATQQKSKETIKCLETSLKQLESGFKSSYNEALTLLALNPA